jgi:hypothetical protein
MSYTRPILLTAPDEMAGPRILLRRHADTDAPTLCATARDAQLHWTWPYDTCHPWEEVSPCEGIFPMREHLFSPYPSLPSYTLGHGDAPSYRAAYELRTALTTPTSIVRLPLGARQGGYDEIATRPPEHRGNAAL